MWRGEGWGRVHGGKQDGTTGTFRKENKEFEGGGFGVACRSGDPSRIVLISQGDYFGSTSALHRVWSQRQEGRVWGGLTGVEKVKILAGGRYEMVVNSCFEGLEGGVGLKRAWEFVPKEGKKRNERVMVSSDS